MAKRKFRITELNHEHSLGNLRQQLAALAGLPDEAFYVASVTPGGRVFAIEGRWDDRGTPIDPETLERS